MSAPVGKGLQAAPWPSVVHCASRASMSVSTASRASCKSSEQAFIFAEVTENAESKLTLAAKPFENNT